MPVIGLCLFECHLSALLHSMYSEYLWHAGYPCALYLLEVFGVLAVFGVVWVSMVLGLECLWYLGFANVQLRFCIFTFSPIPRKKLVETKPLGHRIMGQILEVFQPGHDAGGSGEISGVSVSE